MINNVSKPQKSQSLEELLSANNVKHEVTIKSGDAAIKKGDLVSIPTGWSDRIPVADHGNSYAGANARCCMINDNQLFIAHAKPSSSTTFGLLFRTLITFNEDGTTSQETKQVSTASPSAGGAFDVVPLSNSRAAIFHYTSKVSGLAVTIFGLDSTYSTATPTLLSTNLASSTTYFTSPDLFVQAEKITDNKILLVWVNGNYSYGMVLTIADDDTVTAGSIVTLNTNSSSSPGYVNNICVLSESKVFLSFRSPKFNSDTNVWYKPSGMVCTISGNTLTIGTKTTIELPHWGAQVQTFKLADNKIFMVNTSDNEATGFETDDVDYYPFFLFIDVNGTSFSVASSIRCPYGNSVLPIYGKNLFFWLDEDNSELFFFSSRSSNGPHAKILKIDMANNSFETIYQITTNSATTNPIYNTGGGWNVQGFKVFDQFGILTTNSYSRYMDIIFKRPNQWCYTYNDNLRYGTGVALEDGVTGDTIKVMTPAQTFSWE